MNPDLTEEEMRHALFGTAQPEHQVAAPQVQESLLVCCFENNLPASV